MLLKLYVSNGLNVARQFKINSLCLAIYNTNAVTKSLNNTVYTSDPVVKPTYVCFVC